MNYLFQCPDCLTLVRVTCRLSEHSVIRPCNKCINTNLIQIIESPMLPKTNALGERMIGDIDKIRNQVDDDQGNRRWLKDQRLRHPTND